MERREVLDHGYIELVEAWGSDERIIEAARMSTNKGFVGWGPKVQCEYCGLSVEDYDKMRTLNDEDRRECANNSGHNFGAHGPPGDEKLLRFLWENHHATPFEMAGAQIEVQAPIFVFREWHRHRTQSYNEMSARYTPLPDVNYVPTVERLMMNAGTNKQAQGTGAVLTEEMAELYQSQLRQTYEGAERFYQLALKAGVPKELARAHLPVGRYSRMMASANLRNWLAFLTLRTAPNAQWEIRQYANALRDILTEKFPRTMVLFDEVAR